ncbi:Bet v1-like protein [Violaceomyces palustris]|uniref:Bet v1-like protein n=1 Tax=Violaceomyces palustris TaxID=1673888 RepID=A0ACD0P547_9BASI|nr:Bet v1-like protein [Violaceomyces palustris]
MNHLGNQVVIPEKPAPGGYYECPYTSECEALVEKVLHEVSLPSYPSIAQREQQDDGGWQIQGTSDGVTSSLRSRKSSDPLSMLPTFRGQCRIEYRRPIEVFSAIRVQGYRMMWDTRVKSANILRSFSQNDFFFYLVWRGIGPLYSPRDVAGIQVCRFWDASGTPQPYGDLSSSRIVIAYKGMDNIPGVPEVADGCVRAKILHAGWCLEERDGGTDVTFLGSVDLAATIPGYILTTLTNEIPKVTARLRDAVANFGVPPIIIDRTQCIAQQALSCSPETRFIHLFATILKPGVFEIVLDSVKMYRRGVFIASVSGPAFEVGAVRILEENHGSILVEVLSNGIQGDFSLVLQPRDKELERVDTSLGWW